MIAVLEDSRRLRTVLVNVQGSTLVVLAVRM
jgi:hypothetical protein